MTCEAYRLLLPLLVNQDLDARAQAEVQTHVEDCAQCRGEVKQLRSVLGALKRQPAPEARFDMAQLFTQIQLDERKKARRWKRVALATLALAATVLLFSLTRLEIHIERNQFVLSWGDIGSTPSGPRNGSANDAKAGAKATANAEIAHEKLDELKDLIELVLDDVARRDGQRRAETAGLRSNLDQLRQAVGAGLAAAQRDVSALYDAQFPKKSPSEKE